MHGIKGRIGVAIIAVMTLLLTQGVALAAPVTDTTATATTQTATDATGTTDTGDQTGTATSGDTTGPTTAPTAAPQREPEVGYRALIQKSTPWDGAAQWYDKGAATASSEAVWKKGRTGVKALYFSGTDNYMQVDIAKLAAPFTLSVWVNRQQQDMPMADLEQRILTITGTNNQNEIYLSPAAQRTGEDGRITGNGLLLSIGYLAGKTAGRQEWYHPANQSVSNGLPGDSWHHIALTVEEQKLLVYVDGVLWNELAMPVSLKDFKPATLMLGGSVGRNPGFVGLMEDCRLYEGALTAAQVARLAADADPFDPTAAVTPLTYAPVQPEDEVVTSRIFRTRSEEDKLVLSATPAAAWETPSLTAGQSVSGTLTIQNYARYPARMTLAKMVFPKEGTDAYTYLSQLQITVSAGDEVLYSGPYTELTAEALKIDYDGMTYGAQHDYDITLFCPFDCTVKPEGTVEWDFDTELSEGLAPPPAEPKQTLLMVVLAVSAAAVIACIFWAAKRRAK